MYDHLVHTTPNHHPPKIDVLPKTFLKIILAAKWLVRHSSASPKQQRRPLPSLLSALLRCTLYSQQQLMWRDCNPAGGLVAYCLKTYR